MTLNHTISSLEEAVNPKASSELAETYLDTDPKFSGKIIQVSVDTVELPNGKTATRETVRHCPAVCILAVTEEDRVVLVRQYRYPTAEVLLEVPAGKMDNPNEEPLVCALRELAEETPYTTDSMILLQKFYTAPGFCDELMYLFRANHLVKDSLLSTDDDEFIETVELSRTQVKQAIASQKIRDAKTLVALQHWLLER